MLYKDNGELKLAEEKVLFKRNGIVQEQIVVEGRDWWLSFEKQWSDMVISKFESIVYTPEQLGRFEEIKSLNASEQVLNNYVIEGVFPTESDHGLRNLQLQKENEKLQQRLADLTEVILMGGM